MNYNDYTKEQLAEALFEDGDYFTNFTQDAAVDFFNAKHSKMTKGQLVKKAEELDSRYVKRKLQERDDEE